MKLPEKNRKWLKEVKLAYSKAEKLAERDGLHLNEIYRLAPKYVAKNRDIRSAEAIASMVAFAEADVADSKEIEPGSENNYLFHFVSAYIHGHHVIGLMAEMDCDRVLEYVNDEWNLFPNA